MGVYIPPPKRDELDADGGTSNPTGSSKGASPNSSTIIVITIPMNPSVGLFWGPLTPSPDNLPALYGMTGLQFALGLWGFRLARRLYKPLPLPGTMIPRKGSFWKAIIPFTFASAAVFGCGLEVGRFCLTYDPWFDEAKYYRDLAIKHGDRPSSWFGAYNYYKPLDFNTWSDKVINYVKNLEDQVERNKNLGDFNPFHSKILAKLNRDQKYSEIYAKIHLSNTQRFSHLVEHELGDVTEFNKPQRLDLIAEGKSPFVNPDYQKPHVQLDKFSIETDDQFDTAWSSFDPWDELKLETDYDIRLIPRWRWTKDEDVQDGQQDEPDDLDPQLQSEQSQPQPENPPQQLSS